ncbi:MAG TPA: tetratricopeptide repeat protein [Gammaproteobacteria bacterium]|nr:tetratricopeptide repeat protein [Gammaproteobacteria bacterium]
MLYLWGFWGFSVLLQIIFVVHVLSRGHDLFWVFIILLFPFVGCTVYALMVWIPDMRHSRTTRRTSRAIVTLFDPRRELRRRLGSLDVSDTVENRVALAKELARHGMMKDALALYERSLKGIYEDDPYLMTGYAGALFDAGYLPDARAMLDRLRAKNPSLRSAEPQLLHARVLQQLGETAAADREYQAVVAQHGSTEAKCRYAQFLQQQGRSAEAKAMFDDVIRSSRHGTRHSRRLNKEWISLAKKGLSA